MASIEKRGVNSWRFVVEAGIKADGTRDRRSKTVKIDDPALLKTTKRLKEYLEDELAKFKIEVQTGEYITPGKLTFKDFTENEWLPKYASRKLSESTIKTFNSILLNWIYPSLGHRRIDEIQTMQLVTLVNDMSKKMKLRGKVGNLSDGTIRYAHRILKNIFTRAKEWKLIRSNPMIGVPRPPEPENEMKYFGEAETQEVIKALYKEDPLWRMFVLTALIGGFRKGEIIALQWSDIDFENCTISIVKNIPVKIKKKEIINKTKTKKSRIVDMPIWYMVELEDYLTQWEISKANIKDKWKGGDMRYIFHSGYGKPLGTGSANQWWGRFIAKNKFNYIRIHDLRHTSATLMVEIEDSNFNVDDETMLKTIQKRLGHSRFETTADTYTHVTKKMSKKSAGKFDRLAPNPDFPVPNPSPNKI